jgi:hypothetical protein
MLYQLLDWFFVAFHTLLITFNLFGWIRKAWLRYNLITLLLTGGSWIFLGLFYGLGYCPLTDWHWMVLENLAKHPETNSYVAYLFNRVTGLEISDSFADGLTLWVYLGALCISLIKNFEKLISKFPSLVCSNCQSKKVKP